MFLLLFSSEQFCLLLLDELLLLLLLPFLVREQFDLRPLVLGLEGQEVGLVDGGVPVVFSPAPLLDLQGLDGLRQGEVGGLAQLALEEVLHFVKRKALGQLQVFLLLQLGRAGEGVLGA